MYYAVFFLAAQYSQICLWWASLPLAALMHLLDFDKVVSELSVINQTDACVALKRNQEAVG